MTEKGDGLVVNPAYTPDRHGESGERKILSQALRDLIEKEEYAIAVQLARALIAAASLPDERCVAAQKLMYDRLEGPVEREASDQVPGHMAVAGTKRSAGQVDARHLRRCDGVVADDGAVTGTGPHGRARDARAMGA